jgi:hypothetical protein
MVWVVGCGKQILVKPVVSAWPAVTWRWTRHPPNDSKIVVGAHDPVSRYPMH